MVQRRTGMLGVLALSLVASFGIVLSSVGAAQADCVDPADDSGLIPVASLGVASLSAPVPHQTMNNTVVAAGGTLFLRALSDHSSVRSTAVGSTINGTPIPVELNDGSIYVFLVRQDGRLQKLNASGGSEWTVDLRRSAGDSLNASAAVHLRRYASASFQAKYTTDLVYIATRYSGTGGNTRNRVYAINASTGAIVWTFNGSGKVDMDVAHAAPFLDYANDRLIVGTDRTSSVSQHSLWSIDVITGTKAWSQNVGQLYAAPFVRNSRIYVATLFGDIKALSRTDGASVWTAATGTPIMNDFFPEFREPYDGLIAYTDFSGEVGLVRDDKTSGTVVWSSSGLENPSTLVSTTTTGRVAIDSDNGKLYVGAADGELYQLSLLDGSVEATREVDSGSAVGDPGLVFEGGEVNLVVGSASGELAKFCGPWTSEVTPIKALASFAPEENMSFGPPSPGLCSTASDCSADEFVTPCATWGCVNSVCVPVPFNEGGECDGDGNNNTPLDLCKSGTCVGESDCQASLDVCRCREADGSTTSRLLLTSEPDCPPPPLSGVPADWCGHEISSGSNNNVCLAHQSDAATVVWVHLLDQQRRPFIIDGSISGSDVRMAFLTGGGNAPRFLDPTNPDPNTPLIDPGSGGLATEVSLSQGGLLAASRPGTYYAYIASNPNAGDSGSLPWTIRTQVSMTDQSGTSCIPQTAPFVLESEVRVGDPGDRCSFDSDLDLVGVSKVRVRNAFGGAIVGRPVRFGYSSDLRFALSFEEAITASPTGSNVATTDNSGTVTFLDYGNYMNGGPAQDIPPSGAFEPMHVFVDCPGVASLVAFPVTSADMTVTCP